MFCFSALATVHKQKELNLFRCSYKLNILQLKPA